ncbi:MAG: penicillin acylase family protein [Alphaproteobacteria bacterium]|nr:penicillin acylase family protein [Alphaproteobacteria bacterium]
MRTAVLLSVLLSGCAVTTLMTSGRSLPDLAGAAEAVGLGGKVTVHRDAWGIPHVRAVTEADAAFAVGYAQAQDRLFQLEGLRRIAYGGVAELVGPQGADLDAFMMSLELQKKAEESLRALDPDTRFVLAAYAAGVNAGADSLKGLSVEHRLLKQDRWREWTPVDSMAAFYVFSWTLSMNPAQELAAFQLREKLDLADLEALFGYEEGVAFDRSWGKVRTTKTGPLTGPFEAFITTLYNAQAAAASNGWVLSGERSVDGLPLLANDTHLHRVVPSPWYAVEARGGDVHVAGLTVPGLPFVVAGHNEQLAWGVTNASADYVDFAIVERIGDQGYMLEGDKKMLTERKVEVKVKDEGTKTYSTWHTEIGPVVTELDEKHLLVMRWSALELADRSADMLRGLSKAATVEGAVEVAALPGAVCLNLMLADTEGDIGWTVTGSVPVRRDHTGLVPYLASEAGSGWQGWAEEMPSAINPEGGVLVTANARPEHELADVLTAQYFPSWRQDRIEALLAESELHSEVTAAAIQADRLDTHAQARLPGLVAGITPRTEGAAAIAEDLRGWDFQSEPRVAEPLLWAELERQLVTVALEEKLGADGLRVYLGATDTERSLLETSGAFERYVADRDTAVRQALLDTYETLVLDVGEDPSEWEWGDVHQADFHHLFSREVPSLSILDAGKTEWGGSNSTVNVGGSDWAEGWEAVHLPASRMIMPLSSWDQASVILPPGNSGQPASRHYQDQLRAWARGDRVPLVFSDEAVAAAASSTLLLTPPK